MTDKAKPETIRQYGVTYPDGRTFWATDDKARMTTMPGSFGIAGLSTATERGAFIDAWRASVAGIGLVPDDVPKPVFVTRDIVKTYTETTEVVEG